MSSEVLNLGGAQNRESDPWWSQNPGGLWGALTEGNGNISAGVGVFISAAPTIVYGAYFRTATAGAHIVRIRFWRGAVSVASGDIACAGAGWYKGLFDIPYVVAAADSPMMEFVLSMYETTGTHYTYYNSQPVALAFWYFRNHFTVNHPRLYSAGDAKPTIAAGTGFYPIDPYLVC